MECGFQPEDEADVGEGWLDDQHKDIRQEKNNDPNTKNEIERCMVVGLGARCLHWTGISIWRRSELCRLRRLVLFGIQGDIVSE